VAFEQALTRAEESLTRWGLDWKIGPQAEEILASYNEAYAAEHAVKLRAQFAEAVTNAFSEATKAFSEAGQAGLAVTQDIYRAWPVTSATVRQRASKFIETLHAGTMTRWT
jgi:hypothetical protein